MVGFYQPLITNEPMINAVSHLSMHAFYKGYLNGDAAEHRRRSRGGWGSFGCPTIEGRPRTFVYLMREVQPYACIPSPLFMIPTPLQNVYSYGLHEASNNTC